MAATLKFILALILTVQLNSILGRKLTECEFVDQLKSHGITDHLGDWACLAEHESGLETSAIGGPNADQSHDYGIFQINDRYWCKEGVRGGSCNIKCEDLTNTDISDDIECARRIYKIQGFQAWTAWRNRCQSQLPDVSRC